MKKGEIVTINVTVTLDKCTEANSRGTYVSIAVAGGSEPIMLHVEPICKCDCDKYKVSPFFLMSF